MRILLAEDDLSVSDYVARGLSENGHVCNVLAANIPDVQVKPGGSTVEATTFRIATDYPYRVFADTLDGRTAVAGLTSAQAGLRVSLSFEVA
jgi:hypothetical protein